MNDSSLFLARVLTQGVRAFAAFAAGEFRGSPPDAPFGFAAVSLAACQSWFAARFGELAAAAAAKDSKIFVRQVQWSQKLLTTRGVSTRQLQFGLECMRRVLVRELPNSVLQTALEHLDQALTVLSAGSPEPSNTPMLATAESRLSADYLLATLEGDRRRASRIVLDAADAGRSVEEIISGVLFPAQVEMGRMWQENEAGVAEEHFTSETTKTLMAQLMSRAEFGPSNGKTLVAAGVAGNHIDIGLQAVADFFELDGWRTIQLGANVPTNDIMQAVDFFNADLLGLSASLSTQLETVRATINAVRSSPHGDNVKIIVGGFAFAEFEHLPLELGADGYAPNAAAAVDLGRQLVFSGTLNHMG
jgi:methanogenic corrinoid protein MtbC1